MGEAGRDDTPGGLETVRAAALITGATYVTYALGLVVGAVIARDLGPVHFGQYAYVVWLSGMMVLFVNHALTTSGIRFVSESLGRSDRPAASNIHGWLTRWHRWSALVILLPAMLALTLLKPAGWDLGLPLLAAILVGSVVAKASYLFDISIAKGYRQFSIEAITNIGVGFINTIAALGLAWYGAPLEAYLWLFVATSFLFWGGAHWRLVRGGMRPGSGALEPDVRRRLDAHILWTILLVMVAAFNNKAIETFLLNKTANAEAVAFFAVAAALTRGGADLLVSGLSAVLMPWMAHAYGDGGSRKVVDILAETLRFFAFLGLALGGVGFFIASPAIELMYGDEYRPAIWVFQVMIVTAGLTLSEGAFGALMTTTENQQSRFVLAGISVVVTAGLALWLVPAYGLTGAVVSHAISRAFIIIWTVVWTRRHFGLRLPWPALRRLAYSAVAGVALALPFHLLVGGVAGGFLATTAFGIGYLACTLLFRAWNRSDFELLHSVAGRVPALRSRADATVAWLQAKFAAR